MCSRTASQRRPRGRHKSAWNSFTPDMQMPGPQLSRSMWMSVPETGTLAGGRPRRARANDELARMLGVVGTPVEQHGGP